MAILLLLRLGRITGREEYQQYAEESLKAFAALAAAIVPHAAYYFCGLDAWLNPLSLTVCAPADSELAIAALRGVNPFRAVIYAADNGTVIPCFGQVCSTPVSSPQELTELLKAPRPA